MSVLLGNFRWLAFLVGAALIAAVSWVLWPDSAQNVQKDGVKTSETVKIVHDSTGIKSLRDSVAALRRHSMAVRIIRVTIRDTVHGTEEVYLDSGAVVHDSIFLTRTIHDTLAVHVRDSLYVKQTYEPKKWNLDAGAFVSYEPLGSLEYGASAGIRYKLLGPIFVGAGAEKKSFASFSDGWALRASAGVEF